MDVVVDVVVKLVQIADKEGLDVAAVHVGGAAVESYAVDSIVDIAAAVDTIDVGGLKCNCNCRTVDDVQKFDFVDVTAVDAENAIAEEIVDAVNGL